MNIFQKVTIASLKKNKTRTIVTVIGIILSAAMICAVTTSISSFQNFLLRNFEYNDGSWHGSALDASMEQLETIKNSNQIEDMVYGIKIGYAKVDSVNEGKPYLYLIGASENFEEMMPVHITAGTYPTNQDEILLPNHLLDNGGVSYKIGDVLTFELGDRVSDGYTLGQQNPYYDDNEYTEILEVRETKTFTVVGFYERPSFEDYAAPGYTAITVADEEISGVEHFDVYFTMHNVNNVYSFMNDNEFSGKTNTDVLLLLGASRYNGYYAMLYGLAAIVIALIMFGSISLIYNAFSISVSERTKQFGLLSSIGATKKQLRKMVFFEAFWVSIIGVPIGVAVGVGGISVTLLLIGEKFMTSLGTHLPMKICVSPMSIVVACVVALVTVLISAWIPSRRAMNVTAVEAIRQNGDIKVNSKTVKTSKVTYKLFGLPGVLASKHFKRNRKKYRTTVMSLFMSIVLFVSASALSGYLVESVGDAYGTYQYDIYCCLSTNKVDDISPSQLLEMIRKEETVIEAAYTQRYIIGCNIEKENLTDEWLNDIARASTESEGVDPSLEYIQVAAFFVEDSVYRAYLKDNGLDEKLYMSTDNPLAVSIDGQTRFSSSEEKFVTVNTLKNKSCELTAEFLETPEGYYYHSEFTDENGNLMCRFVDMENSEIYMDVPRREAYTVVDLEIGSTLYKYPYFVDSSADLILLYPNSAALSIVPEISSNDDYSILIRSSDHIATYGAVGEILTANGLSDKYLNDYAASVQRSRDLVTIIQVFSYGFIVLISLIAAANVFNTISTNIILRRREFSMLKSVGMTSKGFNKMMNYECLLYGAKALLYGLPVSVGITYLIYLSASQGVSTGFHLPWSAIGVAVFSVFAVVFATMMYAMRKIKKDNPIDALKNENL